MEKNKKEPIRVAQVIGKWVGGGVETVVMNYYRAIDHNKIQFDFICDSDSTNIPYEEIKKLGGNIILIPPYQHVFKYHKELKKALKDRKYTIVHSHINTLSIFSLFAAKCAKAPIRIAHSHSTTNKQEWKKNLIKVILRPLSKLVATDYMACTEHAGRWMFGNKTFDAGKVYVLNNAIDLEKFTLNKKARLDIRKQYNINEDTFVIGHIGRFVEQKNHDFIIDIFKEFHVKNNNSKLMLIGQGPLMNYIKEKVDKLGLKNEVIFLGQKEDANLYYSAMDLFLFPSLYEGLGMVMIEAQVSGLPCVASTEVPKIAQVTENVKFLSLAENVEEWCNAISNTLSIKRKDYSDEISTQGYDIKKESANLEKYYLEKNKDLL